MRLRAAGDTKLARRVNELAGAEVIDRARLFNRRTCLTPIPAEELRLYGEALDVPLEVFFMEGAELMAWAMQERAHWFDPSDKDRPASPAEESAHSRCTVPWPGHITDSASMSDQYVANALGVAPHELAA